MSLKWNACRHVTAVNRARYGYDDLRRELLQETNDHAAKVRHPNRLGRWRLFRLPSLRRKDTAR